MNYTIENVKMTVEPNVNNYCIKVRKPNGKLLKCGKVWETINRYLNENGYIVCNGYLNWSDGGVEYHRPGSWTSQGDYVTPDPPASIGSELAMMVTIETGNVVEAIDVTM